MLTLENTSTAEINALKDEMVETVKFLHARGWAPATSSNYSFRVPNENNFWISLSGIDKITFTRDHLMLINEVAKPLIDQTQRASAETLLHLLIYENSDVNAVLHTHTVNNTVLSLAHEAEGGIYLNGYEVLKGIKGNTTHEATVFLPIFSNSQDMKSLSAEIKEYWKKHPDMPGFLLAGHGLYCWGETISEAKRHIEVFEFLFDCTIKLKLYGHTQYSR
ncbi:MAG: methylthioribulose 1-phosphate dehydratase [Sphingobacteriales bacterium]|nr:MAG: methylthioribulose 1-phosphate dehydratase [Sphingobacteriales bacterium]